MKGHNGLLWLRTCVLAALMAPAVLLAKEGEPKLGGGLQQMVKGTASIAEPELYSPIKTDEQGRALVRVSLSGTVPAASMLARMRAATGINVIAWDLNYAGVGVIEAYLPVGELTSWAANSGVRSIVPASPMMTNVGLIDSQGVVQHRVDQIPGVDGSGITVGVLSDSYDTNAAPNSAASDVATGDLPGTGNPLGNSQPVVVVQDSPGGTDEGRAMLQIVHDLAPKARLGFATANGGEVNFANNIRSLAGFADAPRSAPGFKADVIVDDIIYLAEPFFQDGIVAQAVDAVAAAGVSYFSSAGNRPATQAYDSKVRIVPAAASSMQGTNLDFSNVDPALYAGGFHDFAAASDVVDIAQTVQFNNNSTIVFQWNEPFDPPPPRPVGAPLTSGVGTLTPAGSSTLAFSGTAGQIVDVFIDADTSTTGVPHPDLTFALIAPDNTQIQFVDSGGVPESLTLELPQTGTYQLVVGSFLPTQFGDFSYRVQPVAIAEQVLSDYNLLFFRTDGSFMGALSERNTLTNRPLEIGSLRAATLQLVIARANTPSGNRRAIADRIRYVGFSGVNPQEYFSYLDPVTFGHNSARGAMGVAAYPFFAPFVPESFTSPGPSTIYFDTSNRRFPVPQIRQKPDLAAMDGANNTFFGGDSAVDADNLPNFFGTSAAAPHAAAIATLVLDAAGGPGKVTPGRMREILQASAFRHDLDPYFSSGFAFSLGGNLLAINAIADPAAISQFDPNVFTLTQLGLRRLQSLTINLGGSNPTQTPQGIVFDERIGGAGQPFVVGRTVGLSAADVSATFSLPADPPGLPGQWKQLDLSFTARSFGSGDLLSFGVDRDEADAAGPNGAVGGNSADLLGGGVLIPSGQLIQGGASFSGRFEGGSPFKGEFFNLIGKGYSQLDGYGFINAEAAVKLVTEGKNLE